MAEERTPERPPDDDLPGAVREWLTRVAADQGLSETELLRRLVPEGSADRRDAPSSERVDALASDVDAVGERIDDVESSIEEARDDFEDKIDDVRDRVIQVKREADSKAPADHEHADLEEAVETQRSTVEDLRGDVDDLADEFDDLAATLDSVDDRVSTGFENFERVLEYLKDTTDDLEGSVETFAEELGDVERRLRTVGTMQAERAAVADLLADANRNGARTARCGACEQSVELGLLTRPRCPHCESGFTEFDPKQGFFGSHTLRTGERPALAGEVEPAESAEATAVVDAGGSDDDAPRVTDLQETGDAAPPAEPSEPGQPAEAAAEPESGHDDRGADGERAPESGDAGSEAPPAGPGESPTDEGAESVADEPAAEDAPLREIEGIGPAYADRLAEAGVESVAALADADPERLADAVDVSPERTRRWIDRAGDAIDGD